MGLNDHPHPYGLVIAGNGMGTAEAELPVLRRLRQRQVHRPRLRPRAVPDERAACGGQSRGAQGRLAKGASVTQEIALSVKGDRVECAINGTTVASYPKADVVAAAS